MAYEKLRWTNYPIMGLFFLAAEMPFISLSVYAYLEQWLGFSPDWSIAKATKWCKVRLFAILKNLTNFPSQWQYMYMSLDLSTDCYQDLTP